MTQSEAEKLAQRLKRRLNAQLAIYDSEEDVRDLCDYILSGDHKREIENAAFERAAKLIEPSGTKPCDCINKLAAHAWVTDCDCANTGDLTRSVGWCDDMNNAERIRALIQPPAQKEDGE